MQIAVRSYLTAGIAVVGATAIVAAPIAVAPPEVHIPATLGSSAAVDLTALANPITEWVQVIQTSLNNVAALGAQVQSDPAPILQQLITNQLGYAAIAAPAIEQAVGSLVAQVAAFPAALATAASQLAAGQFADAVTTVFQAGLAVVLGPVISLLSLPVIFTDMAQNFANVVAAIPNVLLPIGLSAISPIAGVVGTFGSTGQAVIDAVAAGHFDDAISAIVNAPAAFTNAFLNGVPSQGTVGLLTPFDTPFTSGLFATLLNARDTIAQALGAPAPTALAATSKVSELPTAAPTVTLSTATPKPASSGRQAPAENATAATASAAPASTESTSTDSSSATDTSSTSTAVTTATAGGKHRAQSDKPASAASDKSSGSGKTGSGTGARSKRAASSNNG